MKDKQFQIMMISGEDAEIRELSTSRSKIFFYSGIVAVISLSLLYFATNYLTDVFYGQRLAALRGQNKKLVEKITDINDRIFDLKGQLSDIEKSDEALRVYADLPSIDPDIRMVGVGGSAKNENSRLDYLMPSGGTTISDLVLDLDKIGLALKLEARSMEEIYERFKADKDKLLHTPTIFPLPLFAGYYTSGFGERNDPFTGKRANHPGIDLAARRGTPVYATANGVVSDARKSATYGNTVKIKHSYGFETRYAHLSKILVNKHDRVIRGDILGEVGSTGRSNAPHLHYEVVENGVRRDPVKYFLPTFGELW